MITQTEVEDTVRNLICELTALPAEQIAMSDRLRVDINLDSVSSLELLGMMEEEFDVVIEVEAVRHVHTVADICELARRRLDVR